MKTLKVKDIAQPDTTTQFISDVQLSTFYDAAQLNQDLMQRFMFTKGTGGRNDRKGTAELLKLLHQRVTPIAEKEDNRFVFMATYGHGKSHFGLALANFFGAEADSPALASIFGKLDYALPIDEVQMLRDYRAGKAPFLVLILRGDKPGSLRDTFFQVLDRALSGNEKTKDLKPPFWFDRADEILQDLQAKVEDAEIANKFLADHNLDLSALRQLVQERQSRAYQLSVETFAAVYRVQPNLGGETPLGDAVKWIVTELCGTGKPYGGLLVLFDEFSRFIQDYIQTNPIGAPLQEILSGIGDEAARGKALFVGLSQHDPNVIAERYGAGEELIKELNRLPTSNRHIMQTMLEDVLGGVLKTDQEAWKELTSIPEIGVMVSAAADTALALFADRYGRQQLDWDLPLIMEKVAKQCFPLHPLTTAFLASVTLHSTGTVRSVLGFIQDREGFVMPRFDEPAITETGQLNWVLPTRLVDYFGEALHEEKFKNYKDVCKPDLSQEQQLVLKAMLLLDIAELSTKRAGGYIAVVSTMTGLTEELVQETLESLEKQHYVRYDSANKTYSFFVGSNDALTLDRMLSEELARREEKKTIGQLFEHFTAGTNPVNELELTEKHPVAISWGHADDWGAQEVLVPANALNASLLGALRVKYAVDLAKAPEARGVVVLVVPKTQKEASQAVEKVNALLSASDQDKAAPVVFLVPQEAHPDLHTQLLKLALLNEALFKSRTRSEVGPSALTEMAENLSNRAKKTLSLLRTNSVLIVPPAMTAALAARARPNLANRLGEALKLVYELAYPQHPDAFFTQYKQSATTVSKATVDVLYELFDNSLDAVKWSAGAKVPPEIVKILQKDWKIVSLQQQIIEPEFTKVKAAWDRFEGTFSPKIRSACPHTVLLELLQPPYGYDHNTLALLFAAWIGRNRDAISISGVGRLSRPTEGSKRAAFKKPAEFLQVMAQVEIHRKDIGSEKLKVAAVFKQLKDGNFEVAEAKKAVFTLQEFREHNPRFDADFLEQIDSALTKLQTGLDNHAAYEKAVDTFEVKLGQAKAVAQLKPVFDMFKSFPALSVVNSDKPAPQELQTALLLQAEKMAEIEMRHFVALKDIGQYGVHVAALKSLVAALYQLGLTDLQSRAEEGLKHLERAKAELEAKQAEAGEVSVVNSIVITGGLEALRGSLEALRKLDPKSARASKLADQKYEQIKANILTLEQKLPVWQQKLEAVLDAYQATQLRDEILSQSSKYENTSEAKHIADLQAKAEDLSRYFVGLETQVTLQDPADVERRLAELIALAQEFEGRLTSAQQEKLQAAQRKLADQKAAAEAEAIVWLSEQQARFAAGDIKGLEKALNTPHRFLSEAGHEMLRELRASLHARAADQLQQEQQLKFVRSLVNTGSVTTLQGSLDELGKLIPASLQVQAAIDEKRAKIEAELARLHALPEQWEMALAKATTVLALEKLAKDIAREEAHFHSTPSEKQVVALSARLETIRATLRRAEDLHHSSSTRLKDLTEQLAELEKLSAEPALSAAQREQLQAYIKHTSNLLDTELEKLDIWLHKLDAEIENAQSLRELEKIELARFPRSGLPEDRLTLLDALEDQRKALRPLLEEMNKLEQQTWRDLEEAKAVLQAYTGLLGAPAWSVPQKKLVQCKREKLVAQLQLRCEEAALWLRDQEDALPTLDARGLGELDKAILQPHPFLDAAHKDRLQTLRVNLQARLEEDQALQIETLFEKIESPDRRAALLARLQRLVLQETV